MSKVYFFLLVFFLTFFFHSSFAQSHGAYTGFLKQSGKNIVDGAGNNVLLRSMGLGGWMLQEGYMLQTAGFASPQYKIKGIITDLIGTAGTQEFYDAWLKNHCTHSDIDSLAKWGFNAVRLPFHYNLFTLPIEQEPVSGQNTWLPRGFEMVDSLLKWCKNNKMYLILDMHAAPGGQGNDAAISDRDDSKPSFWDSPANQRKAIALWRKLAEKYADEPWIGGYDLLNETNWTMNNNTPLKQYYLDLVAAIRAVDKNHILFVEGNWFANDFTNLTPTFDNNMAYSFHKYWNENSKAVIQWMLDIRNNFNVPIWLGESGENSNQWFADCIALMENNNIGWSWWPVKKIGSVVCPANIPMTAGYQNLLDYWNGKTTKPTAAVAKAALMEVCENLKIENCIINRDVVDALFRQVNSNETQPYKTLNVPGLVHAMDFDMGKNGYAYKDNSYQNANNKDTWNNGWVGRNDGVDLETDADSSKYSNGIHVGWMEKGEWMKYTLNVQREGLYDVSFRVANGASGDGLFHLEKGGKIISQTAFVSPGGSYTKWKNVVVKNVKLDAGVQSIVFYVDQGGFNLGSMNWTASASQTSPFSLLDMRTDEIGQKIRFTFNQELDPKTISLNGFTVYENFIELGLGTPETVEGNPSQIDVPVTSLLSAGSVLTMNYSGTSFHSASGEALNNFANTIVVNNILKRYIIEGKIKGSDFVVNSGLTLESCSDTDGGQDLGYTDAGDYLEYNVYIKAAGTYSLEYRYASLSSTGSVELSLVDGGETILATTSLPPTGGWQTWKTVSVTVSLPAGVHRMRLQVVSSGFNFNWMNFKALVTSVGVVDEPSKLRVYPNPCRSSLNYDFEGNSASRFVVSLKDISGRVVFYENVPASSGAIGRIDTSAFAAGVYFLSIQSNGRVFTKKVLVGSSL